MDDYLLRFFDYHQPRRLRVIENTLKGQRSVANLFWAQQYGFLNWQGAWRTLTRQKFNQLIAELVQQKLLNLVDDEGKLTEKGVAYLENDCQMSYQPAFYDWYWVANTKRVNQRLLLAVQVISEYSYRRVNYAPLNVTYREMVAVKQWFRRYYRQQPALQMQQQLEQFGQSLASEDQRLVDDFFNLLIGHDGPGWTTGQAGNHLGLTAADMRVLRHDEFLAVSAYALKVPGILHNLLAPILSPSPLKQSGQISINLYQRGFSLEQIAQRRHLKISTVREHLLEAALLIPKQLDWDKLLPPEIRAELSQLYQGDVTQWHYQNRGEDPGMGFYQYRLYQIFQGGHDHG